MGPKEKPWYKSIKKLAGVVFLANGLGMAWLSFYAENPNDAFSIISLVLGTGMTLLAVKSATGVMQVQAQAKAQAKAGAN